MFGAEGHVNQTTSAISVRLSPFNVSRISVNSTSVAESGLEEQAERRPPWPASG